MDEWRNGEKSNEAVEESGNANTKWMSACGVRASAARGVSGYGGVGRWRRKVDRQDLQGDGG